MKPLWVLAGMALLGITGAIAAAVITSGGKEDDALRAQESAAKDANSDASPSESKASLPGGYEFSYPGSWNKVVLSGSPYVAKFFLSASPQLGEGGPHELAVFGYENPQQVALEEFFNGQERPNLFTDAAGGYKPFSTGGGTGYWFDNVLGFTNSTVVALSSDGFVYQFEDTDHKHQSDGVFLQIVSSFKRVEGTPTPAASVSATPETTTYVDPISGLSFEYPSKWFVSAPPLDPALIGYTITVSSYDLDAPKPFRPAPPIDQLKIDIGYSPTRNS